MNRRTFLTCSGLAAGATAGYQWALDRNERGYRSEVFIGPAASYSADLAGLIREGLASLRFDSRRVTRKCVLLKPNLVEPSRAAPHINTHPAVVRAAIEVFRALGAKEVVVAEGQGHCRDSRYVLDESGLGPSLDEAGVEFVDLNHDDVYEVPNRFRKTTLDRLVFPSTLRRADLVVSLPKMKTHHWVGVTLSMKNLFGVMPGAFYGWPKNLFHQVGIAESILDITAAVDADLAIVDGVVGMEGDGPIMGSPRTSGVLVMGTNLVAVDATCARLMEIDPWRVGYLRAASGRLGPVAETHIAQRGEEVAQMTQRYEILDHPSLAYLRG